MIPPPKMPTPELPVTLSEYYMTECIKNKERIYLFLRNAIKLEGCIVAFDAQHIVLGANGYEQLVSREFTATIVPVAGVPERGNKS